MFETHQIRHAESESESKSELRLLCFSDPHKFLLAGRRKKKAAENFLHVQAGPAARSDSH